MYYTETKKDLYSKFENYYSRTLSGVVHVFNGEKTKPMTPKGMWKAARAEGNGKIYVNPYFSKTRRNAYNYIRHQKQPMIILRGVSHYCVAYGCYKKKHGVWWTNYYFAVNDNGHEVKDKSKITYRRASWIIRFIKARTSSASRYIYKQRPVEIKDSRTNITRRPSNYRRPSPNFRDIPAPQRYRR